MEKGEQQNTDAVAAIEADASTFAESFGEATGTEVETPVKVEEKPLETEEKPVGVAKTQEEEEVDYKSLFEKEKQRTSSWEGRLSAAEKRNVELQSKLQEMEKVTTKQDTQVESLVDVDDPLIKGFIEEMGDDFIKPLDAYMKRQIKPLIAEAIKPFIDKVPAIEQRVAAVDETRAQEHFSKILEAHADVPELLKKTDSGQSILDEYVNSLPYTEAIEKKKIMENGNTKQVIDFLTEFKEKTGRVKKEEKSNSTVTHVSQERVDAATVVKGKSTVIPKSKAASSDFAGAWAEAVATS